MNRGGGANFQKKEEHVRLEVYSRVGCGQCVDIKKFLKDHTVEYDEHVIGETIDREAVIGKFPEAKALPILTLDGQIVGASELKTLVEDGFFS